MADLHRHARLYLAALVLAALAGACLLLWLGPLPDAEQVVLAVTLAGCMALAWLFPLPNAFKTRFYLDTSVTVAAVLLCPLGLAMLAVAAGTLAAEVIRRNPWDEAAFNAAQAALQAAAGALIVAAFGLAPGRAAVDSPLVLGIALLAVLAMHVVNVGSVSVMIGLQTGVSPGQVASQAGAHFERGALLALAAQAGCGALAALLAGEQPWALPLLLLPVIAVHQALGRGVALQRRAEQALRDSEASLAEAQRIAQLGSWSWDLSSGVFAWSDEVGHILGAVEEDSAPSFSDLVRYIHPRDRDLLQRELHDALRAGGSFSLDHMVQRPDGEVRIVHARGEVVYDAAGRKARMIGTIHDVTEQKLLEARLAQQAWHDSLTGLPNRARFAELLEQALASPARRARLAVLFVDLDHFKQINDSLGHEAGDLLLVEIARRLRASAGEDGIAARLAGDEFIVLLEHLPHARVVERVARRMAAEIAEPIVLGADSAMVTASIGIVLAAPRHETAADLLREADIALYQAKHGGRARHILFDVNAAMESLRRPA